MLLLLVLAERDDPLLLFKIKCVSYLEKEDSVPDLDRKPGRIPGAEDEVRIDMSGTFWWG